VGSNYFTYYSGHRPRYPLPCDVIEWEELCEAIELSTDTTTCRPVMNSPAATLRQETGYMRLHGQRIATPRAEELTGTSSRPEARPVTATARFHLPTPVAGKDSGSVRVAEGGGNVLSGADRNDRRTSG
jgi:hypothetical protein